MLIPVRVDLGRAPLPPSIIRKRTFSEYKVVLGKGSGKRPMGSLNRGNNEVPQDLEILVIEIYISLQM